MYIQLLYFTSLFITIFSISLHSRELSKLPTKNIYAKTHHTMKVFRRTNRFAPQKEQIENGKWNSVLHLDKGFNP